ncbi:uncharacterized protein LOC101208140 [Cucumis sativus]|uniref:RRM domain-containing protein n=1 Tax=Cucumis sativus TaxID=3659 RepID=A0A0A0LLY9_CUCSA|nr:uncharacterized protein LOC101208140 [Cucumis sativus]KGN62945.1 hypothetical protein Csa_022243 [Cucumis sativus]
MPSISLEELHLYHSIDREIFSRLLIQLSRDPAQSLLIISLWLWLEEQGVTNFIFRIMPLSDPSLNSLANEAVFCLSCLDSNNQPGCPHPTTVLPATSKAAGRDIPVEMFVQNRFRAISGVKYFLTNVCARIFTDILEIVLGRNNSQPNEALVIHGFPHPIFGSITIIPKSLDQDFPTGGLWGWPSADAGMSEDDRTLFLTFSRGFPVTAEEVKGLFVQAFGDCVESIQMEEVEAGEQPLYARMVMSSVVPVDQILDGKRIAKFRINGKHIWARKYERRSELLM